MDRNDWAQEFRERYERHGDELKWLYMELYHGNEQAYSYFVEMLCRAYAARSETLRALDRERLEQPDRWIRIDMELRRLPTFVAGLMREQRDPWRVWVLADDGGGRYMRCTPGEEFRPAPEEVMRIARNQHCPTVFAFRCVPFGSLEPTRADLARSDQLTRLAASHGRNAVSLLASQGSFTIIAYAFADTYAAPGCSQEDILAESRRGGQARRKLRLELSALENSRVELK